MKENQDATFSYRGRIMSLSFLLIGASVIPYFVMFPSGPSRDQEHWVNFAQWIGSTLSPSFSFLALLLLIDTYHIQTQQVQFIRTQMEEQEKTSHRLLETLAEISTNHRLTIEEQRAHAQIAKETAMSIASSALLPHLRDRLQDLKATPAPIRTAAQSKSIDAISQAIAKAEELLIASIY